MSNVPPPSPQFQQYPQIQPQQSSSGNKALIIVVSVLCVTMLLCCGGASFLAYTMFTGVQSFGTALLNVGVMLKCQNAIDASPEAQKAIGKLVEAEMQIGSGQPGVIIYKVKGSTATGDIYEYSDKKTAELKLSDGRVIPLDYARLQFEFDESQFHDLQESQVDLPSDIPIETESETREPDPATP